MSDERELTAVMHRAMATRAATVGDATALAERIIRESDGVAVVDHGRPPSRIHPWLVPLMAAALIVFLVGSVVIGVRVLAGRGNQPAVQPPPAPVTSGAPTGSPPPSSAPSAGPTSTPSTGPTIKTVPAGSPVPAGFRVFDLTWISTDTGWALGTAPCAGGRCAQLARTVDGGASWTAGPALPSAMQHDIATCDAGCIANLRFADATTGYAFGGAGLYLTTDAGHSWRQQPLPAGPGGQGTSLLLGLEIADGTALRLVAGCLPGCPLTLQRSVVGTSSWQSVPLPSGGMTSGGQLARAGNTVVIRTSGNPAGGAGRATSVLFGSTDGGARWRTITEPCPALPANAGYSSEVDTTEVSVAGDGTIAVLCEPRQAGTGQPATIMTSRDGGASFTVTASDPGGSTLDHLAAASGSDLLVSGAGLMHSADSGAHWQRVLAPVSYLGFESEQVGRALIDSASAGQGSAVVWTTIDGGAHWTAFTFPG